MNNLKIHVAKTLEEIESCYNVMNVLRPHLTDKSVFSAQALRQIKQGYHLAYLKTDDEVKALIGFRILEFLAWGKVLYIDDLVTDPESRKKGLSGTLLKWALEKAKIEGCDQVHLDSGPHRHEAHKLYLNHGFKIIAHHFGLNLNEPTP